MGLFSKKEKHSPPPKKRRQKAQVIEDINSENYIRPKKDTARKILRIFIWAFVLIVFARGAFAFARPDPVSEIQRRNDNFMRQQQAQKHLHFEIESFAQNFAKEYLTYEAGQIDSYTRRMHRFAPRTLSFTETQNFRNTAAASYVKAYRIEEYSHNQYDVYVMATVDYEIRQLAGDGSGTVATTERDNTYLKVPVRVLGAGAYVVEDHPVFVAVPTGYEHSATPLTGAEVDKAVNADIERILKNFLSAYYEGNQTNID